MDKIPVHKRSEILEIIGQIHGLIERLADCREVRVETRSYTIIKSLGDDIKLLTELYAESVPSDTLESLALRNDWKVGQCFYVQVIALSNGLREFSVLAGQDIPEGTRLLLRGASPGVRASEIFNIDLMLARRSYGLSWKLRSLDRH